MEKRKVKLYFAYNSPYAFLANTRVERELAPHSVELEYKPIYSPRKGGGGPNISPAKLQYLFEDVGRFAKEYDLRLNAGPFADTGSACRGFLYAQEQGNARAYHDAVYTARWLEGRDIGDKQVLTQIAEACGLNRAEFLGALESPRYSEALAQINKEAEADGAFGIPFFLYRGEKFWGNDRIEWLIRALKASS